MICASKLTGKRSDSCKAHEVLAFVWQQAVSFDTEFDAERWRTMLAEFLKVATLPAIEAMATAFIRQQLVYKQQQPQTIINAKNSASLPQYTDNDKVPNNESTLVSANTYTGYSNVIDRSADLQQGKQKVLMSSELSPYYGIDDSVKIFKNHKSPDSNNLSTTIGSTVMHRNSNVPENLNSLKRHETMQKLETNDEKFNWQMNNSAMVADNALPEPVKATEMKTNVTGIHVEASSQHADEVPWVSKKSQNPNINGRDLKPSLALTTMMMIKATKTESVNMQNTEDYTMTERNFFTNGIKNNNLHATTEQQDILVEEVYSTDVSILESEKQNEGNLSKTNNASHVNAKIHAITKLFQGKMGNAGELQASTEESIQNDKEKINTVVNENERETNLTKLINIRENSVQHLCKEVSKQSLMINKSKSDETVKLQSQPLLAVGENIIKTPKAEIRNIKGEPQRAFIKTSEQDTRNSKEGEKKRYHQVREVSSKGADISFQNIGTIKEISTTIDLEGLSPINGFEEPNRNSSENLFRQSDKNSHQITKAKESHIRERLQVKKNDKGIFSEVNERKLLRKWRETPAEISKTFEMPLTTKRLAKTKDGSTDEKQLQINQITTTHPTSIQHFAYKVEKESKADTLQLLKNEALSTVRKNPKVFQQSRSNSANSEEKIANVSTKLRSDFTNREGVEIFLNSKFNSSNSRHRNLKISQQMDNYLKKGDCDLKQKLSKICLNDSLNELKSRNTVNSYSKTNKNDVKINIENYKNVSSLLLLNKFLRPKRKKLIEAKLINFENIASTSIITSIPFIQHSNITQMSSKYETNIENYVENIEQNMTEYSINSTNTAETEEEITEFVTNDIMITESALKATNEISYNDLCCDGAKNHNNSLILDADHVAENDDVLTTTATTQSVAKTQTPLIPETNINNAINNSRTSGAFHDMITIAKAFATIPTLVSTDIISVLSENNNNNNFQLLAETTKPSITNLLTTTGTAITASIIATTTAATSLWPVKHAAVVEGEVILGGLMMVHSREDTITCGPIMPQGGIQALEAMLYTLDQVNKNQLLPNVTLGAHILDDCDKDTYGLEMAVDFIKDKNFIHWYLLFEDFHAAAAIFRSLNFNE
uniref:Receptor ligand binding region domain-containing protein n=1 Tax=Glossina pallidipes TaxID=7398 RepID=A0A1A9ZPH0_GLOPL